MCRSSPIPSPMEPPPPVSSAGHTSTTHSSHSPGDTSDQSQSASNSKTNDASGPVKPGRFFKRHRSPDIKGGKKEEEQDLQMAMAMSVSLEENQEQFEIDQQLHYQQLQEAEGEDPTFRDDDDVEEAALTAAICASLGQYHITTTKSFVPI